MEADSVAEGLRPAEENDVLELDECWTCACGRSNKRWLRAQLRPSAWQVVANAQGDRSAKTCARLWSRIPRSHSSKATGKVGASETSGNPPKRQLLPVFEEDATHRQVGKSSGELVHAQALFRAASSEAGPTGPTNTSSLRIRTDGSSDDETVRRVVQRSCHLASTRYHIGYAWTLFLEKTFLAANLICGSRALVLKYGLG